MMNWRII